MQSLFIFAHKGKARIRRLTASPTLQTVAAVSGGSLLATVIGLVGTLVQVRFVGPDDLGYFQQFGIVTAYAFYLQFGISAALQRLYPLYIGRAQRDKALAVAEICQSWNIGVSVLVSGSFAVLGLVTFSQGNWRAGSAWLVQAIAIVVNFYGGYLSSTYRSGHDFVTVAKGTVLSSIAGLFTLPLFLVLPYLGLAVRSSVGSLVSLVYLHRRRPLRLPWRFTWRDWFATAKDGIWLHTAYYGIGPGKSALEATLVVGMLGTRSLGLLSISYALLQILNKVAEAISAVYIPRVIEEYGRTGSVKACLRVCRRPMLWGIVPVSLMGFAACFILPVVVPWLMPKYTAAISTMCLLMLTLPMIILDMPSHLILAQGHFVAMIVISYTSLGCFTLFALLALRANLGLNGVVGASLLSQGVRLGMTYLLIGAKVRQEQKSNKTAK